MIIPTRAHYYSLFIWEFGGFWGTAPFYGKYFEFHMTLATQEARAILDEFIISIEKTSSSNTLWNSYFKGSSSVFVFEHSLNAIIGSL